MTPLYLIGEEDDARRSYCQEEAIETVSSGPDDLLPPPPCSITASASRNVYTLARVSVDRAVTRDDVTRTRGVGDRFRLSHRDGRRGQKDREGERAKEAWNVQRSRRNTTTRRTTMCPSRVFWRSLVNPDLAGSELGRRRRRTGASSTYVTRHPTRARVGTKLLASSRSSVLASPPPAVQRSPTTGLA